MELTSRCISLKCSGLSKNFNHQIREYSIDNSSDNLTKIKVGIENKGIFRILISSDKEILCDSLFLEAMSFVQLFMLMQGYGFLNITEIIFSGSSCKEESLIQTAENLKSKQLGMYRISNAFNSDYDFLIQLPENFEDILKKWPELYEKLGFQTKVFLVSISNNDMLIDIKLALLIQCFENSILLISGKHKDFKSYIIKAITDFGRNLFDQEGNIQDLSNDINGENKLPQNFLRDLISIRNSIFHVNKKKYIKISRNFSYLKYFRKFSVLYRLMLMDTLSINIHADNLNNLISVIDIDKN